MNGTDGEFVPPPEAPVFEPTTEEFKDPLAYIAKIKHIVEQTGICKIKPPPDWQPPFAVDVENFRFTPRLQRLNELEATTRIKLNFLDQIAKFWDLQGSPEKAQIRGSTLKIPNIEKKALDLYNLFKVVREEGGMECVTQDRKWSRVAARLGYSPNRNVCSLLRQHYERILYPYALFISGATLGNINLNEGAEDTDKKDRDYVPHGIPSRQAIKPPPDRYARRSKRHAKESDSTDDIDYSTNNELRKLQFYGAGPKMPGYIAKDGLGFKCEGEEFERPREKKKPTPIEQIVCHKCGRGDDEENMLLCDGCDDSYHTFCLIPPLSEIPKGDWRCPVCVAMEVRKPQEAFGFEQARKEYTLQEFGSKADSFKADFFKMAVHKVPPELVEKEFWRIVSAVDEDVTVEYGADLHTMDHGSGFPKKNSPINLPEDEGYATDAWNLNNLPVLEGSVFRHINADISGMKIPWTYVGMCFATFCWHNEDHWSYSINYLHWGEPKTWYGVPGGKAEAFENAMRQAAPELFNAQPDLLHQLVTIMNPNILMAAGVPIFRTNQKAGEFVITFPRSYHAGFNQGYNFAEAVNFAPADWLPIGRVCIAHYSMLHRFCVFSHDELVCKMAADPDRLDISLAASTYQDMLQMVGIERDLRRELLEWGVTEAEREAFELLPDDERQCDYCKTTCFLSAVTCSCNNNKLVCIPHREFLCDCPPSKHCLRYRYTLDELPVMLQRLKARAESFDNWAIRVKAALEATEDKLELEELKELIEEAEDKKFPSTELLQTLTLAVQEAENASHVAEQFLCKQMKTRNRQSRDNKSSVRISFEELKIFYQHLDNLPCVIKEATLIKDLFDKMKDFEQNAKALLAEEMAESRKLEKVLEMGTSLDIELPEVSLLKQKLVQSCWLEEVQETMQEPQEVTLEVVKKLLDSGISLPPHPLVEKEMALLQEQLTMGERWEERAKNCLQAKPRHSVASLEALIAEANEITAYLPHVSILQEAVEKAKDWSTKVEFVQNGEKYPYLDVLENLVNKGRPIPVRLEQLPQVESQVAAAKSWRERTARTFLKKNSSYTLLEVLSPRKAVGVQQTPGRNKKRRTKENVGFEKEDSQDVKIEDSKDPASIVAAFKESGEQEMQSMKQLREHNLKKKLEDTGTAKYCVCNKIFSGHMLQCELCKDWFHANCVPMPKVSGMKKNQNAPQSPYLSKEVKFLCPSCLRSRRPRLETILSLLMSLQKLPVRLPEGEALQCLTERAMSWQDRARQALATDELATALARLSIMSQRLVEQAAREKTEKIISTELLRAASNPELQPQLQTVAQSAFSGLKTEEKEKSEDKETAAPEVESTNMPEETIASMPVEQEVTLCSETPEGDVAQDGNQAVSDSYNTEHAYSSASKATLTASPRKHSRKSPLIPRQLESPVLELSENAKIRLEELMMEGDLLEVSLDETQHIWRILQATKPAQDPLSALDSFPEIEDFSDLSKKAEKKVKKRKLETAEKLKKRAKMQKKIEKVKPEPKTNGESSEAKNPPKKVKDKKDLDKKKPCKKIKKEEPAEKPVKKRKMTPSKKNDDSEDFCSASKCLRPQGEAVNWVQCDGGCEKWFHLYCVGLSMKELNDTDDYFCPKCITQPVKTEPCSNESTLQEECVLSESPETAPEEDPEGESLRIV